MQLLWDSLVHCLTLNVTDGGEGNVCSLVSVVVSWCCSFSCHSSVAFCGSWLLCWFILSRSVGRSTVVVSLSTSDGTCDCCVGLYCQVKALCWQDLCIPTSCLLMHWWEWAGSVITVSIQQFCTFFCLFTALSHKLQCYCFCFGKIPVKQTSWILAAPARHFRFL